MDKESQSDETSQPLNIVQKHIPEVKYLFEKAMVEAIIKIAIHRAHHVHLDHVTVIYSPGCAKN